MKKRRIFIIGLIVLLLACPSCMIYITVKQQDGYKKRVADNTNEYMLQFLTMAVESKTDPDYKPLNFNGLDEKSQEAAITTMNEIFKTVSTAKAMKSLMIKKVQMFIGSHKSLWWLIKFGCKNMRNWK